MIAHIALGVCYEAVVMDQILVKQWLYDGADLCVSLMSCAAGP